MPAYGGNAITDNTGTGFTLTGTGIKKVQDGKFGSGHVSVVKTYDLDGKILSFQNVSSFIRFSLERTDIDHIVFKSQDKTAVVGDGNLSFTFAGTDYSVGFSSGVDSLTLNTNGAGTFYIATLPCEMEGFDIKCYDKQNHFLGEIKKNKKLSLSANKIVNLGTLDEHIVDISVQCLSLNTKRAFLQTGDAFQFSTTIEPYYAKVKSQEWHIDDEGIATLSEDGKLTAKSEGRCFVTVKVNGKLDDTCVVDIRNGNDLSRYGTANSYIVSKAGTYKFRADVKGNSTEPLGDTPFKAVVLWESFGTTTKPAVGDVVTDVSFSDGYIHFTSGSDGNAVIAVKSIDDEILWSWHIWVCGDYSPERYAQPYYHKAGIMMDRNIGATTTLTEDLSSQGLLFQWGRKDPFPGTIMGKYMDDVMVTTGEWYSYKTSGNYVFEHAIKNPTTYIYSNNGNPAGQWGGWASDKSVYDPCPIGWKVPEGGNNSVWAIAMGRTSYSPGTSHVGGTNAYGIFGNDNPIYYPNSISRNGKDEGRTNNEYAYWSCTDDNGYPYCLVICYGTIKASVYYLNYHYTRKLDGYAVRCVQE